MIIEEAFALLRDGARIRRPVWHACAKYVVLMTKGGFTEPYLIKDTNTPEDMEWPLSLGRADWLATDWEIVDEQA